VSRRPRPARASRRQPGDLDAADRIARILRVDQAGEFGALQIYKGQLAVLAGTASAATVEEMAEAERRHLETFDRLVVERGVRPTALTPIWRGAGLLLGAVSALISERHAMACTAAVEETIDRHYRRQAESLGPEEAGLQATLEEFRADELRHRETALEHRAAEAVGYAAFSGAVRTGTRLAIWLSERL
jgi:ubiquinone biosynthesis monooxygenase Coq7